MKWFEKVIIFLIIVCLLNVAYWGFSGWMRNENIYEELAKGCAVTCACGMIGAMVMILIQIFEK